MARNPSQLTEAALVSLDVGHDASPMLCRVVAFGRDDVVLAPTSLPDQAQRDELDKRGEAFLLLDAGNDLRALRCRVREHSEQGDVMAQIVDRFRLGQRRMFSRAPMVLRAHVTPLGPTGEPTGETWTTFTRDVSAGGARLARQSGYGQASRHAVVLEVPGGHPSVQAVVEVLRESPGDLGVRFLAIAPDDRVRLEQAAITWQRARLGGCVAVPSAA